MARHHIPDLAALEALPNQEIKFYAIVGAVISLSAALELASLDVYQRQSGAAGSAPGQGAQLKIRRTRPSSAVAAPPLADVTRLPHRYLGQDVGDVLAETPGRRDSNAIEEGRQRRNELTASDRYAGRWPTLLHGLRQFVDDPVGLILHSGPDRQAQQARRNVLGHGQRRRHPTVASPRGRAV